jgi:hypothetical protein
MANVLADLAIESEAHRHRDAHRTCLRRGRRSLPPRGHRGMQVLGLQARPPARPGGAGVPGAATAMWRSRVCRGSFATPR